MQTHATPKGSASHASKPFFGTRPARPAAFFPSAPVIQAKLSMGAPGDPFEREADTMADRVVQRVQAGDVRGESAPAIQAKCSQCRDEEKLQAKSDGSMQVPESVHSALEGGQAAGQAMPPALRDEMEAAFQADFSNVRIHAGPTAENLSRDLRANAFTHGTDIYFNSGEYRPESPQGRHLLAHELTHVMQQSGGTPSIQRDEAGGGSTEFTDTLGSITTSSDSPVVRGTMTRVETAPASGSRPRQVLRSGSMNVAFDPTPPGCAVTIPFNFRFVQAAPAERGPCDAGPTPAPMSTTAFNALKANFLRVIGAGLNGWFDVEFSGSECPTGCTDRRLPIRVVVGEDDANPDRTVTVVNRPGRSDSGNICVGSWSDSTAVHESGHQVLGMGDEYPETDESFRESHPGWFRPERVRRDYSRMGPEQDSRFAMFHERHFAAVTTFLSMLYPRCNVRLIAHPRPVIPDFRINFGAGFASISGLSGFYFRAGFDFGIPLDRLRRWEVTLGPEFTTMLALGDQRLQTAFLFGARLGLEGSTGDADLGVSGGPFVSAGYGLFHSSDRASGVGGRDAGAAYGEVGARFGIRQELDSSRWRIDLEGAGGSALGAPGIIGPAGPAILSDPARSHWFRVGLGAAVQF
jgi:hypothetical protein